MKTHDRTIWMCPECKRSYEIQQADVPPVCNSCWQKRSRKPWVLDYLQHYVWFMVVLILMIPVAILCGLFWSGEFTHRFDVLRKLLYTEHLQKKSEIETHEKRPFSGSEPVHINAVPNVQEKICLGATGTLPDIKVLVIDVDVVGVDEPDVRSILESVAEENQIPFVKRQNCPHLRVEGQVVYDEQHNVDICWSTLDIAEWVATEDGGPRNELVSGLTWHAAQRAHVVNRGLGEQQLLRQIREQCDEFTADFNKSKR